MVFAVSVPSRKRGERPGLGAVVIFSRPEAPLLWQKCLAGRPFRLLLTQHNPQHGLQHLTFRTDRVSSRGCPDAPENHCPSPGERLCACRAKPVSRKAPSPPTMCLTPSGRSFLGPASRIVLGRHRRCCSPPTFHADLRLHNIDLSPPSIARRWRILFAPGSTEPLTDPDTDPVHRSCRHRLPKTPCPSLSPRRGSSVRIAMSFPVSLRPEDGHKHLEVQT